VLQPAHESLGEWRVPSERVVHPLALADVLADLLVELVDRIRHIGAVLFDRAFDTDSLAGPGLTLDVAGQDEQHELFTLLVTRQE